MATKEQLARIIQGKASALCSVEGDKMINSMSRNASQTAPQRTDEGRVVYTDIPKPDYNYDTDYELETTNLKNRISTGDINYSRESAEYSTMPDAIKRSMLENRIDTSSLGQPSGNAGFLDELAEQKAKQQRVIRENTQAQQPVSNVDYALIKTIVKECLEEANKSMLNEGSNLKTIKLSGGNIRLVDNSGNIYSAKLEKTGNINDKKK